MAPDQNDTVFPEEDLADESQEDEEEEEDDVVIGEPDDDEETEPSPSSSAAVTVAVPGSAVSIAPVSTGTATRIVVSEESKRHRSDQIEERKPVDDSRKLFQRLWTDEDEIGLLQGFLEYTIERGSSHHNDTALFYDQIKSKLQLGFNKNQLVEKLRRLKKKYRNVLNKIGSGKEFSFKSPHDQATFEISRKIWSNTAPIAATVEDDDEINLNLNPNPSEAVIGNSAEKRATPTRKRSRSRSGMRTEENRELNDNCISNNNDNNYDRNNNINCKCSRSVQGLIEETVKSCLSPLLSSPFREARGFGVGGFALNPYSYPLPLNLNLGSGEGVDEKWRRQQILELEVYSKRLELVQDEIKAALDELRSAGAGAGA